MAPVTIRYPLDPTGVDPNNLVQGELHTMPRRKVRAIATLYGAFYSESLVIVDTSNNQPLVQGQHYSAVEMYEVPTAKYGKEVCAIILITDESVGDEVSVQYQAVGGEFSSSATAVAQLIDQLNLDDRPVAWPSIIEKPSEYPPSHHLHDIGDVYGFEYVVHALERIRSAIELGDSISHDKIYSYLDNALDQIRQQIANNTNAVAGKAPINNPHFTGQVFIPEGTAAVPGLTFENETNSDTGLYHAGDGNMGISADGAAQAKVTGTGVILYNHPKTPTQAPNTNSDEIASTAYADAAVAVEAQARVNAVSAEAAARSSAINAVNNSISTTNNNLATEASSRTSADAALQTKIDDEISARTNQISTINDSLATKENLANKATSFATVNNILYPTVQAVKAYVDSSVVGLIDDRGTYNASSNTFPTTGGSGAGGAVLKGDLWYVGTAGTLGGQAVNVGDSFRALVDAPGQTGANWSIMEGNLGFVPYPASNPNGYTANSTDAQLRDRSTHTGTQPYTTITGLGALATQNNVTAAQIATSLGYTPAARNADNTFTGRQFLADSAENLPTLAFGTDGDSGIYHNADGMIGFTVNAVHVMVLTPGTVTVNGAIVASGNVSSTSDKRTKKKIVRIKNALDKVKRLVGVTYSPRVPRGTPELPRRAGLIAQDVLKEHPEVVGVDANGHLNVAYGNMMGLIVEAIKDLSDEVEAIRNHLGIDFE